MTAEFQVTLARCHASTHGNLSRWRTLKVVIVTASPGFVHMR